MTDQVSRRALHIRGLQVVQPSVMEIIDDATHVAIYRFITEESKWVRMDIEGSAYVTRNSTPPLYSLIVMNKKGEEDLILHVKENMDKIRIQDKYLMIRCKQDANSGGGTGLVIFGVWIHDDVERQRIFDSLNGIHAKASQPSAGIDLLSRLNGLKVNAAPVATTAAPASAPVTSPVPSASASKLLSVLKSPATTTGTAAASSSSSTAPSIQKPAAATTSPSAAPSSYLQALRGEQSPVTPPVTTSASSSASTAVKTPAAISATVESVPAAAAPAATATATKTPVKVPVSRLFVPTQVTVSPKPATSVNTATAAPAAYEVRTTDSGSIHAPAVVPVVSLPLSPKPVASAPAPAAAPVPPPASASKGLALMSLLKSGNGNSADTTQPLVTPPKPADVSAPTPLSSLAITPAAKTTASTAPASAAKANALLSILKPPTAPVSTPAPAPAPAAVTPAQVQAKNLLDLLTDPQIAASTKSKASVAAVPPGLPTTVPAPATAAPAGLTRRLDVSELLAGKATAASASRPPLQDRETKDGKSRSSSFGNDLVNNANTGSTPLKTAEALLLRRDKERSNSNTSLSSVGDSAGANTFAQESSSRKEVLKNFLISPSMLEG